MKTIIPSLSQQCPHIGLQKVSANSHRLNQLPLSRFPLTRTAVKTVACAIALAMVLATASVQAQDYEAKYSPDHPDVKAMADLAVSTLNASPKLGEQVLHALAIVQHGKRYHDSVPRDNPLVVDTINRLRGMFPPEGQEEGFNNSIFNEGEMYFPCLALILMAETDKNANQVYIRRLLKMLKERQEPTGAFTYKIQPGSGDTSQTQFAALAMLVAKTHGFEIDVDVAKRTLEWLCRAQQPGGFWYYKLAGRSGHNGLGIADGESRQPNLSMQSAGLGSVYLLADVLQLSSRAKAMAGTLSKTEIDLPRTVSIYVKPVDGESAQLSQTGPLVNFDRTLLKSTMSSGNSWMHNRFRPQASGWNYYYLYALERYAYFREQNEGDMRGMEAWYDETIEWMKTQQNPRGDFPRNGLEKPNVATAFAVLFMVRSSEVITNLPRDTKLLGGLGFQQDAVLMESKSGQIKNISAEKDLREMLELMDREGATQEQLREVTESLKKQIVEFREKDSKSRGEIKDFLRQMIGAKDYYRRMIAVRFLAGEQDMDNVPALLFALGDPDFRICIEAHDGLRLISRKIDSMKISKETRENSSRDPGALKKEPALENNMRLEFDSLKKQWTEWFLKIRPGAELLD